MTALSVLTRIMPLRYWLVAAAFAVMAIGLIWAVLAWGDARYREGADDADERWEAAADKLAEQTRSAGTDADRREAERMEGHADRVAREKEKIDAATASGDSPLDALFGGV